MNGLAWTELYNAFSKFAYLARKQKFYEAVVQEMEYSLFEMCPIRKSADQIRKEQEANER
jgi:hypothetical protein